jgi:tetratricopeptide (TPR) repeat protein
MSVKYRLRLQNDRVIGPFTEQEVVELFEKKHILGEELCQQFPIGEWKKLSHFQNLIDKFEDFKKAEFEKEQAIQAEILKKKLEEEQLLAMQLAEKKTSSKKETKSTENDDVRQDSTRSGIKTYQEFKFDKNINAENEVDYKELEKKYKSENGENDDGMEKTRIIKRVGKKAPPKHFKQNRDVEKTVVKNSDDIKDILQKAKDENSPNETNNSINVTGSSKYFQSVAHAPLPEKSKEEMVKEQTQFMDIKEVLPKMNAQLIASEVEFERQANIEENKEKIRRKEELEKKILEQLESEDSEYIAIKDGSGKLKGTKKRPKKMSWVALFAFLGVAYFFLYTDEKPVKNGPLYFKIEFPITKEFVDATKAKVNYQQGLQLYKEATYIKRSLAAVQFLHSVESQFSGNPALGNLIMTYAELMENAKDQKVASTAIYKLLKLADQDTFNDPNTALGAALFYGKINKPNTGINIVKNFLRVGSKPSIKLLATYLDLLQQAGELADAKKVYDKIIPIPQKPFEVYVTLAKYLMNDEKSSEAQTIIEEGLKYYPNSVLLLLTQCEVSLKDQSFEKLEKSLKKAKALEVESSPVFLANYYKYFGMELVLKQKNKEASEYFKKSLALKEDDDLRNRLAELEIGGSNSSQKLIIESKIISLIKKAKEEIKNKNWETATSLISEAVEANPDYIPSMMIQADLQEKRGLFDPALNTLNLIKEKNPTNYQIIAKIVQVYLKAFKYDDAQKILIEGAQSKFSQTPDYAYLYGQFFEGKGNNVLALRYYDETLRRNPLDDRVLFKEAEIYFKARKYADAKKRLSEAMILDPKNTDYISLYAQILNDQDNADTAIGYLRDVINERGEDSKLLSTIASIYFKTGQLNEFKYNYKKIQQMPKKDEGFYEFLISAAKMEESYADFELYSKELLKINPGNLKIKMTYAEFLTEKGRYLEAVEELNDIKVRLPSYPKVHYMLAKVYMAQGDLLKAKKMAEEELKMNPMLDSAFYIVGEVEAQNKQYREAVAHYEKAISISPKYQDAIMALGNIRLEQNQSSEALDLYMRVLKIDPNYPEVHRQMAYAYRALGQRSVAREKFEDYLKLNPAAKDKPTIDAIIRSLR